MIEYRLLLAHEVIVFLDSLKSADRKRLMKRFLEITSYPARYADYEERDAAGRRLDVNIHAGYAIAYWEDFADRHLKVLDVRPADH
jgi:hypothetical protein